MTRLTFDMATLADEMRETYPHAWPEFRAWLARLRGEG